VVSLSPPLTETLFYLGASRNVVAVSDYCREPPELLPWLTLHEVAASVRRLGALVGRVDPAERLAAAMERTLSARPPPDAPSVLLVIDGGPKLGEVVFVRDNSLHGAALRAAGARNAAQGAVSGVPSMSLEALVELDPSAIVILAEPGAAPPEARLEPWQRLTPLHAVREGRLAIVAETNVFGTGPSILALVPRLHHALVRIGVLD
jgi:ABC-type Fe3+-hydroxamate transport system substrate-binding protein